MASTEGTRGGDSRPPSVQEIDKLPTYRCRECGLVAVRTIVDDTRFLCRNEVACRKRVRMTAKADAAKP